MFSREVVRGDSMGMKEILKSLINHCVIINYVTADNSDNSEEGVLLDVADDVIILRRLNTTVYLSSVIVYRVVDMGEANE